MFHINPRRLRTSRAHTMEHRPPAFLSGAAFASAPFFGLNQRWAQRSRKPPAAAPAAALPPAAAAPALPPPLELGSEKEALRCFAAGAADAPADAPSRGAAPGASAAAAAAAAAAAFGEAAGAAAGDDALLEKDNALIE